MSKPFLEALTRFEEQSKGQRLSPEEKIAMMDQEADRIWDESKKPRKLRHKHDEDHDDDDY